MSVFKTREDIVHFVKWASSLLILAAIAIRGSEVCAIGDILLSFLGTLGWLYVSICWKDRALIMMNTAAVLFLSPAIISIIVDFI